MSAWPGSKVEAPRRLPKSEIRQILRRNYEMYRNQEGCVDHLLDLAMYLLEFEYDWKDSSTMPPARVAEAMDMPPAQTPANPVIHEIVPSPRNASRAPVTRGPATRIPGVNAGRRQEFNHGRIQLNQKVIHAKNQTRETLSDGRTCPFCGVPIGRSMICPSCRNLTY